MNVSSDDKVFNRHSSPASPANRGPTYNKATQRRLFVIAPPPRHCERSVAIQCPNKLSCWISASQAPRDDETKSLRPPSRHCERSVAIQCSNKLSCWIAASQAPRDDGFIDSRSLHVIAPPPRHCERSVAIQCSNKLSCWIAASQAPRDDGTNSLRRPSPSLRAPTPSLRAKRGNPVCGQAPQLDRRVASSSRRRTHRSPPPPARKKKAG